MDTGASAPDPSKEKCDKEEEEMKKQPECGRRNSNEMSRPDLSGSEASAEEETGETEEPEPAKEKCDKEEEMKEQPECGRKRKRSNEMSRPDFSGCEASAEEETGETEEHEPVSGREASAEEETGETEEQEPMSGREASAEEETGETEEQEPMNEVAVDSLQAPEPRNRAEFLKYSCQLTLDPNTAHRELCLSEGNRKVTYSRDIQTYPCHPDRFDYYPQVLCREGLSGTRCYWEIECSGRGAVIGVTYKGISRKGEDRSCILGFNDKSWSLLCSDSSYSARHNNNQTEITAPSSPRIGVYLDFNAGTLSFYGVSDTMTLLHRFQTTFTEPLYPGFGPAYEFPVTICQLN